MNITLQEIIQVCKPKTLNISDPSSIDGISIDSRSILPSQIFFAIKGKFYDGHSFINDAYKRGACASIVSYEYFNNHKQDIDYSNVLVVKDTLQALHNVAKYYLSKFKTKVIVVTGSCGKTTVKDILFYLLKEKFNVKATTGNLNNYFGVPLTIFRLTGEEDFCILECGINQFGELDRLGAIIKPWAAIITKIGKAHLEFLDTLNGVLKAKWEIVKHINKNGFLLINGDDPMISSQTEKEHTTCRRITFGQHENNDFSVKLLEYGENEQKLCFVNNTNKESVELITGMLGISSMYNIAAAASCACTCIDLNMNYIKTRLKGFKLDSSMRLEKKIINGIIVINDAYNSNPTSMEEGLNTVEAMPVTGKKIVVIGDMCELGKWEEQEHRNIGKLINKLNFDYIFCYGNASKFIFLESTNLGFDKRKIFWYNNKIKLIEKIKNIAVSGDVIYLKASRKMQLEEILKSF